MEFEVSDSSTSESEDTFSDCSDISAKDDSLDLGIVLNESNNSKSTVDATIFQGTEVTFKKEEKLEIQEIKRVLPKSKVFKKTTKTPKQSMKRKDVSNVPIPKKISPNKAMVEDKRMNMKERTKKQRLGGQSGIGSDFKTWRSDEEMAMRQQFD